MNPTTEGILDCDIELKKDLKNLVNRIEKNQIPSHHLDYLLNLVMVNNNYFQQWLTEKIAEKKEQEK